MKKRNLDTRRILVMTGLVTIVILAAGLAMAQGPGQGIGQGMKARCDGDGDFGPGFRLERLAARLDLSDEQQEAIEALHEANRGKAVSLRKEMMRLRNQMQGEMLKDDPSEKTILSLNEKMGEIRTELKANRLKTRLAVREQLTPEQRDQMLMMGERGGRGGRGFDGPRGGHFRGHRGDRRGPGCDGGRERMGRHGMSQRGMGMGQGDGTGPRAGIDCPKTDQAGQ